MEGWHSAHMIDVGRLEELYDKFNHRRYVSPDPIEVVYQYKNPRDQEVVAFIAAMLSYGRVASILKNVNWVLDRLEGEPYRFLTEARPVFFQRGLGDFKHRWTTSEEMSAMLLSMRTLLSQYGSLENAFMSGYDARDKSIIPAMGLWTRSLNRSSCRSLIARPEKGSACKRLHMYLRWMVRSDNIDLGLWTRVRPDQLFVPLDTHMFRVSGGMGLTSRKQANFLTVQEVTEGFRRLVPEDPVRYDFALTRLGIRKDESMREFLYGKRILKQ